MAIVMASGEPLAVREAPAVEVSAMTVEAEAPALAAADAPAGTEAIDAEAAVEAKAPPADPAAVEEAARASGILGLMGSESGHFLASPYGGAFAVGSDDADVWGGLTGTEVGESYGVGGLGLVGTGRGGGGTGEGTIGLGSGSGYGRGSGAGFRGRSARAGRFDPAIQSRVLTVGVVDDNADRAGYAKALEKLAAARAGMNVPKDMWEMEAPARRHDARPRALDVALVIDTTGSMGDELEYLKVEIRDIAREIEAEFPGVEQRWGMVVYKDRGDEYVTRKVDFADIDAFVASLGEQSAGGGGDYPEAMDAALTTSAELGWRGGDEAARMVFLVADAPAHAGAATRRFASAVMEHRAAKTAIYAVAGSGVGDEAEAELRLAARVTGGQYIFLTDHSGVGGSHAAPKVDQFEVESLHDAMARMIRGELGGDGAKRAGEKEAPPAPTPAVETVSAPAPVVVAAPPAPVVVVTLPAAPAQRSFWDEVAERLAAHLLFVSGVLTTILIALGLDALVIRRRRR